MTIARSFPGSDTVDVTPPPATVSWYALLTPLLRGWRIIAAVAFLAGAVTAAAVLLMPRKYRASMTLSTVYNPRMAMATGGLGALLNANTSMGLQATPPLIVLLASQYGVLDRVSRAPMARSGGETIGARLRKLERRDVPQSEIPAELQKQFSSGIDKPTGVITFSVVSRDSAFARAVATELVAEISRTFVRSSKAQATEMREAMQARVDSAASQLRRADVEYRAFNSGNRVVAAYSEAALRRDELERARTLAQTIFTQAVTDRENAVARELEETPAVVVLDDLPRELLRQPRGTALKSVAAALAAAILTAFLLLLRAGVRRAEGDADLEELGAAMATIPLIGTPLARLLGVRDPRRPSGGSGERAASRP
jgi:uncharacterized protein involved in exopolysaccharide biosynthesis